MENWKVQIFSYEKLIIFSLKIALFLLNKVINKKEII